MCRRHHSRHQEAQLNPSVNRKEQAKNMTEQSQVQTEASWRNFLQRHLPAFATFVAVAFLAVVGAVYVFVWFTGDAQATGLVPSSLGLWSMANLVGFILHIIFWELVLIGVPAVIGAVAAWQWWKRLPETEKTNLSWKRSKSRNAGGAISPLLFIAFAIKVYVDGNWHAAIGSYTLDYVVGSVVSILIWIAAIFAIPAIIGIIWWLTHK
jgi:hypothetical protein